MNAFTCISVIQPWPWLLLRPDIVGEEARAEARRLGLIKDVENRGWETKQRGWVLLHASATRLPMVSHPKPSALTEAPECSLFPEDAVPSAAGVIAKAPARDVAAKLDWPAVVLFAGKRGVEVPLQVSLPHGAIVGAIRIDGCERWMPSRWFGGPVGLVIGAAVPFAKPIPAKGALKFFSLPAAGTGAGGLEQAMEIAEQIRAAGLAKEFRL